MFYTEDKAQQALDLEEKALLPLAAPSPKPGREVIEKRQVGRAVYQLEKVRCGKEQCRWSVTSNLHVPTGTATSARTVNSNLGTLGRF